jgi:protoporphyrinogen/coproporphyrinogen III oxidase
VSDAIIVGGGISGLAAAYYLSKKGLSSTLIEAQSRLGGLIRTDLISKCQIEAGPDSYVSTKPEATELAEEIPDLKAGIIGTNDESRRIYLVNGGKLVPMPAGMVLMVPGDMRAALSSCLFPDSTRRRILDERFIKPKQRDQDISVADLVVDHFDRNMLETIAEPLLTGVYGGDAGRLSAASVLPRFLEYERHYGSLVRAVRAERKETQQRGSLFLSFKGGMQALTDAVYRASSGAVTRVTGEATRVTGQTGGWQVHIGSAKREAKFLIIAVPAHKAAQLFSDSLPPLSAELAAIPYSSAITVVLGYARSSIAHPLDGFGFLVPRAERRRVAACTWINTKFPQRIAPEYAALRAFLVDTDAEALLTNTDEEIIHVVRQEFMRLMGIDAEPVFSAVQRWPLSMPQYVVGHGARRQRIFALVEHERGLYLVGNAYEGVGIPDCIRLAKNAVSGIEA